MEWYLSLDNLATLNEWIDDIDIVDCVLVNLIQKYSDPSRAPGLIRTDKGSVWINHTYLLKQLPFLKIKVDTLGRRFKKLADIGILEREYLYPQTDKGVRKNACYRLSEAFVEMCLYFKEIQSVHSSKDLSEEDKQRKLAFLLKEKPKIPRVAAGYHKGSYPQARLKRDEKGRFRTVFEYGTQRE